MYHFVLLHMKSAKKLYALLLAFTALNVASVSNSVAQVPIPGDSLTEIEFVLAADDPILAAMDELILKDKLAWRNFQADTTCLNVFDFPADFVPTYPDSVIMQRLEVLNEKTPFDLTYNTYVKAYIQLYVERRRELSSKLLGLAEYYYPLFEQKLDQFNIPLELKHLAVVESALNPEAKSWAGATGLWQFMYNTGKLYDLKVTSYVDERCDPYASTIAACRYFTFLYSIYSDWNLVLAAYNAGPGNVNKAIRRSGGKKDYWEIYPFLSRETRGYVPAFIAVNYLMNYATEHNLYPLTPSFMYAQVDTVHVHRRLSFDQIALATGTEVSQLQFLNPTFRRNVIPLSGKPQVLYLPVEKVGVFLANQDSVHKYNTGHPQAVDGFYTEEITEHHTVRNGEVLGSIANRHNVSVQDLKNWNNIRGSLIHPGDKLVIHKTVKIPVTSAKTPVLAQSQKEAVSKSEATPKPVEKTKPAEDYKYYTVQSGDTLWDIAGKYPDVSVTDLKKLNNGVNFRLLKPGQKIKIKAI